MRFLLILFLFPFGVNAQFFHKETQLVYGINIGTHIASDTSSFLHNGYNNTNFNISSILFNSQNNAHIYLNETLGLGWELQNVPSVMKYRLGVEIGIHLGIQNQNIKYYLDYNFAELKAVGEFNVVQPINSTNMIEKDNVLVSVIGEERRSYLNIGLISNIVDEKEYHLGFPIFLQINQIKFKSNYMLIDNQKHNIPNPNLIQTNNSPNNNNSGGIGIGLGSGIVGTASLTENINFSIGYHLQYSTLKPNKEIKLKGIHHSIFARLIWNKN